MKAVGIIGIILIAVFVIVMLMTFAFHLIVFKLLLVTRDTAISNLDRNEIASTNVHGRHVKNTISYN